MYYLIFFLLTFLINLPSFGSEQSPCFSSLKELLGKPDQHVITDKEIRSFINKQKRKRSKEFNVYSSIHKEIFSFNSLLNEQEHLQFIDLIFSVSKREDISPIIFAKKLKETSEGRWKFDLTNRQDQIGAVLLTRAQLKYKIEPDQLKELQKQLDSSFLFNRPIERSNLLRAQLISLAVKNNLKVYEVRNALLKATIIFEQAFKNQNHSSEILTILTDAVITFDNLQLATTALDIRHLSKALAYSSITKSLDPFIATIIAIKTSIFDINPDLFVSALSTLSKEFSNSSLPQTLNTPYFITRIVRSSLMTQIDMKTVIKLVQKIIKINPHYPIYDLASGIESFLISEQIDLMPTSLRKLAFKNKQVKKKVEELSDDEIVSFMNQVSEKELQIDQLILFYTNVGSTPFLNF